MNNSLSIWTFIYSQCSAINRKKDVTGIINIRILGIWLFKPGKKPKLPFVNKIRKCRKNYRTETKSRTFTSRTVLGRQRRDKLPMETKSVTVIYPHRLLALWTVVRNWRWRIPRTARAVVAARECSLLKWPSAQCVEYSSGLHWRKEEVRSHALMDIHYYIHIFIAIALDETSILVALHFSMQNIYQSCDLGHAVGRSNINVSQ